MSKRNKQNKNNLVGRGMKPRGNAENSVQQKEQDAKPVDPIKTGKSRCNCWCNGDVYKAPEQHAVDCPESLESRMKENSVSTDQVQPEGAEEAKVEAQNATQTPPNQGPKSALEELAEMTEVVPGSSVLLELLRQSAEDPEKSPDGKPSEGGTPGSWGGHGVPLGPGVDPEKVLAAIKEDEQKRRAAAAPHSGETLAPVEPPSEFLAAGVGPRPNGDLGVVLTVPESFVQPVRDFAESDGNKSVEQWVTEFFVMNLEAYCTPMKGR